MASRGVRIWDLPTRIFHWVFAALILLSWLSGQFGGAGWREWHFRFGYALLALLIFRLLWGFAGDRYARFAALRFSPSALWSHWRIRRPHAGHSPAAAFSVGAMLLAVAIQITSGLMATDGSFTEGPWAKFVSNRTMEFMTSAHAVSRWVVLALVTLHLAAVAWYELARREALVRPMIDGNKHGVDAPAADDDALVRWRAAILLALSAALAGLLVTL